MRYLDRLHVPYPMYLKLEVIRGLKYFDLVDVTVVTDKEYIGKVYNYMHEINNAYFFDGYDSLCVIKFDKK